MKVRWTRESVRLRITPSELEALGRGDSVHEELPLPGGKHWSAFIQPDDDTRLASEGSAVIIYLSESDLARLMQRETEGIYFQQEGVTGLRYLIEKDFPCVHPRAAQALEPPNETFASPEGFAERKKAS